jgi:hypothetical protein
MSVEDIEDAASRPDEDNPEWTREDFRTARPALAAIAELFGEQAADAIRQRGGRMTDAQQER